MANVSIAGLGGTGSWLMPIFTKYLGAQLAHNFTVGLFDYDVVEYKNIERQNFIFDDIGLNKAEVLVERYSNFKNVSLFAQHRDILEYFPTSDLYISCVDNINARQEMLLKLAPGAIYIDSGNEDLFGQVGFALVEDDTYYISRSLFDLVTETRSESNVRQSCLTLSEQTMFINHNNASAILKMLIYLSYQNVKDINNLQDVYPLINLLSNQSILINKIKNNRLLQSNIYTGFIESHDNEIVTINYLELKRLIRENQNKGE